MVWPVNPAHLQSTLKMPEQVSVLKSLSAMGQNVMVTFVFIYN